MRQDEGGHRGDQQAAEWPQDGDGEERVRDAAQQHRAGGDAGDPGAEEVLPRKPAQGPGVGGEGARDAAGPAVLAPAGAVRGQRETPQ